MKRFVLFATMSLALLVAVSAMADGGRTYQITDGVNSVLSSSGTMEKASRDTTWLLGGPNAYTGRFQDAAGNANWQGWTHKDITFSGAQRWNIDNFNVPANGGTLAMWCGQRAFPNDCGDGYGNDWSENLVFTYTVPNPSVATVVGVDLVFNSDSEPGFDYFYVQYNQGGSWQTIGRAYDGTNVGVLFSADVTFQPSYYVGSASDQLQLRCRGFSDGAWSDEDCLWDTVGLAQVDNIVIEITGGPTFSEDFEDGISQDWVQILDPGVGDYAFIWTGLQDLDQCISNFSPQVAFIDDGVVVPGTGGSSCVTWCYGPGGYIVNPTGGLMGPTFFLNNIIISPVLEWIPGNVGASLAFSCYRHMELIPHVSTGMWYQWHVRSVDTGNPADLETAVWKDRNFIYYGPAGYVNTVEPFGDLLVNGCTHLQVALRLVEIPRTAGYDGVDGTPAPYFDNIAVRIWPAVGPVISAREIDMPNDGFPERGDIDLVNLQNNWVRFDMARNISTDAEAYNNPGDSIFVDLSLRTGATLTEMPKLVVKMKANPLFDGVRVLPANFTQSGDIIDGWVYGDSTRQSNGTLVANRYNFDLPDSTFFFPGDVIHYYISATDNQAGNIGTSTLPGDVSGVGEFGGVFPYPGFVQGSNNSYGIVRALPTLFNAAGEQPEILFWNDFADRGGENEWLFALNNLGYNEHDQFDVFFTKGPSSGVGNGLGGRATSTTIGGYNTLLYTAGNLTSYLISNGDFNNDPSDDVDVLANWFNDGDKKAFMTGDDLINDLVSAGSTGFVNNFISALLISDNILPLINSQTAPTVVPIAGNSVFTTPSEWVAYGGCIGINDFDAIEATGGAERIAQFLTPAGNPGYSYAAALRYTNIADVIVMPYDFMFIYNPGNYVPSQPGYSVRTEILRDILIEFGHIPTGTVIDVPAGDLVFGVSNYPNPFNPATEIKMTLPQAGHVSLKVFNLRGELVRTLVNGELAAGPQSILWNGTTDTGREVASGVYFYETKYNGETRINKMALVK